jgi:5-methyltetrahydrofolate--homocysteine methyltransferase
MIEMEKTVKTIKKSQFDDSLKIIVGGAPVTKAFTERIGADAFGKDAVDGVLKMKSMVNSNLRV